MQMVAATAGIGDNEMIHGNKHMVWALGLLAAAPMDSWACATCGCTVDSDAAMGYSTASGWRVNLEYTYIDQDELRSGTGSTPPAEVVNNPSNPSLGGGEIEKDT